ncbi:hypothetical protein ITJ43_14205 [Microbacterium sp. VKM Ac-2870]|uniref:hypothetical protein n=1 Tax=Microbacterium sp. VKM Ac-2870 TaxID=2783825 RepID=UPI00188C84EC|nr:hypothetical protein [Microbacterium sp. VKM Ac-2870]MBF4563283.1 hypothetical protein [Microbacterium sp. VKM Ac-2870]
MRRIDLHAARGDWPVAPNSTSLCAPSPIRGSLVDTRHDMIEAFDFYARGAIDFTMPVQSVEDINDEFERMKKGKIDGRIVLRC